MRNNGTAPEPLLPEWDDDGEQHMDDAAWIAALEESRRAQFAELADL